MYNLFKVAKWSFLIFKVEKTNCYQSSLNLSTVDFLNLVFDEQCMDLCPILLCSLLAD